MQFRLDVGNGPGSARRPGPGSTFPAAPLRGGFPVDYGPRVDDRRYTVQMSSRQQPPSPKSSQGGDDQEEASPSRHLWVGNVSQEVTEGLLLEKFSKFGPIESVTVYSQRNYAFINFRNLDSAKDAKNGLQGVALGGLAMRIEYAKGVKAKPSRHLWVGGISQTVSREQIEDEFRRFGMMEDFKFIRDRNCAFVDYEKVEDAIAAVDSLNRKRIGEEELRVDFGRSQPPKRDISGRPGTATSQEEWGGAHSRNSWDRPDQPRELYSRGPGDGHKLSERGSSGDNFRGPLDGPQAVSGPGLTGLASGRSREKEEPSDVLWVGFPLLSKVDEEGLRRAFVPYGEVERIKTFPGRTYAFVQFKNVEEASRAKDALEGKLFNDPRVHIRFSNSEIGPVDNPRTDGILISPSRGREASGFSEKVSGRTVTGNRFGSIVPPLRPTGLRPEYYPGGLARGAAMARAVGTGAGVALGHSVGRILGPGGSDGRAPLDDRDYQAASQVGSGLSGPSVRHGGRPLYTEQWDLPDEEISREPKRLRMLQGGGIDSAYVSSYEGGRRYSETNNVVSWPDSGRQEYGIPSSRSIGGGDEYSQGSGIERIRPGSVQIDGPRHAVSGQGYAHIGAASGFTGAGRRDGSGTDGGVTGVNEGWRWHGTIAKGGTPVCRAQCLPVGKGIDVTVPDVVNCTARTDLDMLAKHVYQAGDFGVVFFVPEADPDVPPYHDFMHYLGEKHRAGVAKLADGTTLFLVPPSEFSERVLKVPGNNCLFGVVLKSQQGLEHAQFQQQQPPPPAPPSQAHHLPQQQSLLQQKQQYSQSQGSAFDNGHPIEENGAFPGPCPPQGQPPTPSATSGTLDQSHVNSLASGLPAVLTPELIISLTALLPQHNQSPVHPSAPLSTSGSSLLQPPAIGAGHSTSRGTPSLGTTLPVHSSVYRPPQSNQQSILQSQGWLSSQPDQPSGGGGQTSLPSEQGASYVPLPQPPQAPHASNNIIQQPTPGLPPGQVMQGYPGAQSRSFSVPGYGGQQLPLQPRPPQHPPPQLIGAPLLPSDQLAQLTALLTQRQQQPAQQQHAAQLLQQHYQQQQYPIHALSQQHQQPPPHPSHQPQVQSYNQQPQPQQYLAQASSQQQWAQGGTMLQHPSPSVGHPVVPSGGSSSGWDGAMVAQGQHPPASLQQPQIAFGQQQALQPSPIVGVTGEQAGASSHDDAERQKRFQATLQLAAALLQQMQHQQTPGQGHADQR